MPCLRPEVKAFFACSRDDTQMRFQIQGPTAA